MEVTFADNTRQQYEDQPFARGAQGELYRSRDGQHVAKLFVLPPSLVPTRLAQVDKIIGEYNVVGTDPYWNELFSWPDKRVTLPRPGVRMRRVQGLTRMDSYFWRTAAQRIPAEQQGWWIGRVACAIKLARAMARLSNRGLCHSDLSDKNLMVDPFSGELTVLDCDSLVVPGVLPPDVIGTPGYMAPEIVAGHAKPTTVTDLHALAVLLYRWLLFRHPLLGPKHHAADTDADEHLMMGERALYIEHPSDTSNRPSKMQFTAAEMLTPRMVKLFDEAFVDGLHHPFKRPVPGRWEAALIEMLDSIVPCPNGTCELKFFVAHHARPLQCPLCHSYANFPSRLPFLNLQVPVHDHGILRYANEGHHPHYFVGWPERPLYAWHANPSAQLVPDGTRPLDVQPQALVRFDATQDAWYVQNLTLPQMLLAVGTGPHVRWMPVPQGSMAQLHHNGQLLLGAEGQGRKVFVELRRVR